MPAAVWQSSLYTHPQLSPMSCSCFLHSVLTPYRHYFRALTGSLLAYLLYAQGCNRRTLTTLVMCAGLVVSQDVLSLHNRGQLREGVQQLLQQIKNHLLHGAKQRQEQQRQQLAASRTKLQVTGMRCEGW